MGRHRESVHPLYLGRVERPVCLPTRRRSAGGISHDAVKACHWRTDPCPASYTSEHAVMSLPVPDFIIRAPIVGKPVQHAWSQSDALDALGEENPRVED